jgi:hypothetical protein
MDNFPQYTDMSPEIREASAKINAAVECLKAYANAPLPDRDTILRMQWELEEMINSCPPWSKVDA